MKKLNFAVAMIAAVSMVVTPVAPSFAQDDSRFMPKVQESVVKGKQASREKIVAHAQRGEAAIVSKAQMDRIAKTNPKLHARLMAAYNAGTVPSLSVSEKKMLVATTNSNLEQYKAGLPAPAYVAGSAWLAAGAWFAIGLIGVAALLIFLYVFFPQIFRAARTS
jgi:hypothetical protein